MSSPVCGVHRQSDSGGSERVTDGERTAPKVQFVHGDLADLFAPAHNVLGRPVRVHGLQVGQDLAGEGLVVFEDVNVLKENVLLLDDTSRFWFFLVTLRPMPWALRTAGVA